LSPAVVAACASRLFFRRRKLYEQVRPIASDNAAYLVIDHRGVVVAFLNLPVEHFQFVGTERATVQEIPLAWDSNEQIRNPVPSTSRSAAARLRAHISGSIALSAARPRIVKRQPIERMIHD